MTSPDPSPKLRTSLMRNWISMAGIIVAAGSLFSFFFLFALDIFAPTGNPYVGILAYMISPAFLILGLTLMTIGIIVDRRRIHKETGSGLRPVLTFDLSKGRDRRRLLIFAAVSVGFLFLSALGSYRSYHFTESVEFCGEACHEVMKPEFVTYKHSPHARVSCSECHIGPGATWYVKSKISGAYQVYSTLFEKYSKPIPTPIHNLRPAQETCEQCHWPEKFVGNLDRTYQHFLGDEENTPYAVRLLLKVGGGDPRQGPTSGIHWHMNVANRVEYVAADERKQEIPYVRVTSEQGVVTEYKTDGFEFDPAQHELHVMDCMDCHNRPSHIFKSPNEAVDLSLAMNRLDRSLPSIKTEAVDALTGEYETEEEAIQGIATKLNATYADFPNRAAAIEEVQRIFRDNIFPEMKASWAVYPNNIGHKIWPGCFRCHDDEHKTPDESKALSMSNCDTCHVIVAEGGPEELEKFHLPGLEFQHPEEGWEGWLCSDCHSGSNE